MMSLLNVILLAALAILAVPLKKSIELALENEYGSWAPALARVWIRWAGFICRSYGGQWWADLQYLQRVERNSGLLLAASCLANAPLLAIRHAQKARRDRHRRWHGLTVELDGWLYDMEKPIEQLDLSVRTFNLLKANEIQTVGQLLQKREDELLAMRNFGRTSLDEVKVKLVEKSFIKRR